MAADSDPTAPLTVEAAASLVGEPTRASILVALGEAWDDDAVHPEPLTFTALMDRVGVDDGGRFNYHLSKLVGPFVEKRTVDGTDGYFLTQRGRSVYQTFVAGTLTENPDLEPVPVGTCCDCGGSIHATVDDDHVLALRCDDCDRPHGGIPLPPRALDDWSNSKLVDAAYQRLYHELGSLRRGVCPACAGRVERRLDRTVGDGYVDDFDYPAFAVLVCTACTVGYVTDPATVLLTAPKVVGFLADHGRDPALVRSVDDLALRARESITLTQTDPNRVAVEYRIDDDRLGIVADDTLQVTATN
jgi:hypothetical protein